MNNIIFYNHENKSCDVNDKNIIGFKFPIMNRDYCRDTVCEKDITDDGKIIWKQEKNGDLNGLYREYYKNGNRKEVYEYNYNVKVGYHSYYNKQNELIKEIKIEKKV